MESDYRVRVYEQYVNARTRSLAPETLTGFKPRASYLKRLIHDHFPRDRQARILDLGCGSGALLHFARLAGYKNISGVDTSLEQVAAAQSLGIEGVRQSDLIETLRTLHDESQNCIVAFDVVEHFTKQELIGFVDDVYRKLIPGGRWIIHTPNGESPFGGRMRYWDITHELAFTRESISQLLYSSGFAEVRCFEDTPAVHGVVSAARWVLWKMIRSVLLLYIAAETGDTSGECIFSQNLLAVAVKG